MSYGSSVEAQPAAVEAPPYTISVMLDELRRDAARYTLLGGWMRNPGFWIGAVYRYGVWASQWRSPWLRLPLRLIYRVLRLPLAVFNVHLWAGRGGAKVGPGLCLIHPTNVTIGSGSVIGEDCLIFNDVTLGTGARDGQPRLGNRIDVYVGARVLGGVTVGDDVMIGANCVVTNNIPNASIVVAASSRILPRSLSPLARAADARTSQAKSAENSAN